MPIRFLFNVKVMLLLCLSSSIDVQQGQSDVATKAELLFSLSKFVAWPDGAVKDSFNIHIIGNQHFYEYLSYVYQGRNIKGLPVKVTFDDKGASIHHQYHIIFISSDNREYLEKAQKHLQGSPILIVGENMDITHSNLMVNMQEFQGDIELELDPASAQAVGLNMRFQLLQVASRVLKTSNK